MAFMDRFKKQYMAKVICYNCGTNQDLKIPKGQTIDTYISSESAVCDACGCPTLRRVVNIPAPQEVRRPVMQSPQRPPQRRPMVPPRGPQRPPIRQQRPQMRPHMRPRPQRVDYPVTEPVPTKEAEERQQEPLSDDTWNPIRRKVNFWTGKEEK